MIEASAVSEMRNLSLGILDIGSKAAFEAYTDWQCKIDDIRERSIRKIDELGYVKLSWLVFVITSPSLRY
jgi:hypothetical protein